MTTKAERREAKRRQRAERRAERDKADEPKASLEKLARYTVWLEQRDDFPSKSVQAVRDRYIDVIDVEYGGIGIIAWLKVLYYAWQIWKLLQTKDTGAIAAYAETPSPMILGEFSKAES